MQQETDTNVSTVTMQSSIVRVVGFESSENLSGIVHLYETLTWRSGFGKLHGGNYFRSFSFLQDRLVFSHSFHTTGRPFRMVFHNGSVDPKNGSTQHGSNTARTSLNHLIVFSGWNRPKDDTERLATCLNFCWFFHVPILEVWLSGVDRGRTSPKAQAESTTQTAGLAGRGPGELVGLMGSRRGND